MMDLVHSHQLPKLYDLQKEKTWNQRAGSDVSDRVGKRVGILGYGSIGRQGKFQPFFHRSFKTTLESDTTVGRLITYLHFPGPLRSSVLDQQHQYSVYYAGGTVWKGSARVTTMSQSNTARGRHTIPPTWRNPSRRAIESFTCATLAASRTEQLHKSEPASMVETAIETMGNVGGISIDLIAPLMEGTRLI